MPVNGLIHLHLYSMLSPNIFINVIIATMKMLWFIHEDLYSWWMWIWDLMTWALVMSVPLLISKATNTEWEAVHIDVYNFVTSFYVLCYSAFFMFCVFITHILCWVPRAQLLVVCHCIMIIEQSITGLIPYFYMSWTIFIMRV